MAPGGKHILQACTENAIQIGQVIQALQAIRTTQSQNQAQQIRELEQHLASLQSEYAKNCLGK